MITCSQSRLSKENAQDTGTRWGYHGDTQEGRDRSARGENMGENKCSDIALGNARRSKDGGANRTLKGGIRRTRRCSEFRTHRYLPGSNAKIGGGNVDLLGSTGEEVHLHRILIAHGDFHTVCIHHERG